MANEKSRGAGRTRSWTFVLYPESAPNNWRDIIDDLHMQWVESPLHDKDENADGTPKKPHWHILLCFDSVKTFEQVKELTDSLNAPIPQKCHGGAKGLIRYMAHLDNPEKAQYQISDIIAHGGFDLEESLRPTSSDRYELVRQMISFIRENNIIEYKHFFDYCMDNEEEWYKLLCDNSTYVIKEYIKSNRHSQR